ncbi:MAG: hypothetical protein NUV85_01430 [Candidatus Berkelbacteria bacterium]|nr:hypothetical protein [Candidatus Berkelbacteria bacterium]
MERNKLLIDLGLSEKQARTYVAILELGSAPIKPVAQRSGVKRTSIYNFIDELVGLGLVTQTKVGRATHYQASPPSRLAELQRERLKSIEQALPEFTALYNTLSTKPRIHYFVGIEQMKNIVHEETRCKKEALYIWPNEQTTETIGGKRFMDKINQERISKGIRIRSIRFHDPGLRLLERSQHGRKNLLTLHFADVDYKINMAMGLYDTGKVGFFGIEGFGILIESKELHQLMLLLFELLWKKSKPAKKGEG